MPTAVNPTEVPSVALSFANNFWGKDDAGVGPLIERMLSAKQTCDELKSFYAARASIEDEYARKLMSLSRKPLGSYESGSLKGSLDVARAEIEAMARQHQGIASQMKTELEEPLAAFAGGMKERRKIVQTGIEKLLKVKVQQTQHVNKARDRYEQECLKIKGYLAQGHMVMGQEERRNKAKLEKTQISVATSNTEYENAVKALEDTTVRWNREWKGAADKFQDLEEERLDFTKSSLWQFANIASTVCVSDDSSCEKIRLSLEKMDVEQDIVAFIKDRGTGQEIPDAPRYINFCRGDINDSQSEISVDENYSVAQFPRDINPAFRTSSPQPSTYESHHDPNSALAHDLSHRDRESSMAPVIRDPTVPSSSPRLQAQSQVSLSGTDFRQRQLPRIDQRQMPQHPNTAPSSYPQLAGAHPQGGYQLPQQPSRDPAYGEPHNREPSHQVAQRQQGGSGQPGPPTSPHPQGPFHVHPSMVPGNLRQGNMDVLPGHSPTDYLQQVSQVTVTHQPYSPDGVGMLSGTGQPAERNSLPAPARPSSQDSQSEISPTPTSSPDVASGQVSPVKIDQSLGLTQTDNNQVMKKKSGFFQNHSPFRRKSMKEAAGHAISIRSTWGPDGSNSGNSHEHNSGGNGSSNANTTPNSHRQFALARQSQSQLPTQAQSLSASPSHASVMGERSVSPDPIDANASLALNVGRNVFAVTTPDIEGRSRQQAASPVPPEEQDPIALALAELKGGKQPASRISADRYHGIATPVPTNEASSSPTPRFAGAGNLSSEKRGTPPPSYDPTPVQRLGVPPPAVTSRAMKEASKKVADQSRHIFGSVQGPLPPSAPSRPSTRGNDAPSAISPSTRRSTSPHPISVANEDSARRAYAPSSPAPSISSGSLRHSAPLNAHKGTSNGGYGSISQPPSRQDHYRNQLTQDSARSASPASYRDEHGGSVSSHGYEMAMQLAHIDDGGFGSQRGRRPGTAGSSRPVSSYGSQMQIDSVRQRSKSVADPSRQYTQDGHPILHFARAMYMYHPAIPEELGFTKNDILAILGHQDDGWWRAQVHGLNATGQIGLVPSNYLQPC